MTASTSPEGFATARGSGWRVRALSVNDAESRVALFLVGDGASATNLTGRVAGPRCVYARTVEAAYRFRPIDVRPGGAIRAGFAAFIPESCLWEPVHPFLYEAAWSHDTGSEEQSVEIGLRKLVVRETVLRLNGKPFHFRGLAAPMPGEDRLKQLRAWGCNLLHVGDADASPGTDRCGPFVTGSLPPNPDEASAVVGASGPTRPSVGVWLVHDDWPADVIDRLRREDPTTLFARAVSASNAAPADGADLRIIQGEAPKVLEALAGPDAGAWVAQVPAELERSALDADAWEKLAKRLDETFLEAPGCVGWIAEPRESPWR